MGRPKTNDDAVRDRLVVAATQMLATQPQESISVRGLAAAAGAATAAVYTLFGSKDGLIAEVRDRAVAGLYARLAAVPSTPDAGADIRALAAAYREWARGHRHLYAVLFGGVQTFDPTGPVGAADPVRPLLAAIGRAGLGGGDPTGVAVSLWAALHGLVVLEHAGALDRAAADRAFVPTVDALLRGWAA
jgi:AcrR family transcriptional regulator